LAASSSCSSAISKGFIVETFLDSDIIQHKKI
jgi:hypothetical protein